MTRFLDDVAGFKGTEILSEDPKVDLREYGLGTPDMTIVVSDADGKTLGTLIGARGPEKAGDPNAKAFVSAVGSGIVYLVKPFVYDRIDKKRADFRDAPKPSPGAPGAVLPTPPPGLDLDEGNGLGADGDLPEDPDAELGDEGGDE